MDNDPSTLASAFASIDWAAIATIVASALGAGGLVTLIAKLADKLWPPAEARLQDGTNRRKEHADRVEQLEEELRLSRAETLAANQRWLTAEQKLLDFQKVAVVHEATATIVRKNIEHPSTALVQPPPDDPDELVT